MLVSGKNVAYEVLKNYKKIKKIYLADNFSDENIISKIEKLKLNVLVCPKFKMDDLCDENHQGIILDIKDYEYCDLSSLIKEKGFIVMLDHIVDPHNFGAIIRTCEAANVDGIVIPKDRSVKVNSTVMKTSAGALENVKIAMVTNLNQAIKTLKQNNYWIYGTDMGGVSYDKMDYNDSSCIIIGNEGSGMSDLVRKNCDQIVSIPMIGKINSLNASVASGILIYEVVRQRHK